ncbi:MAG TPA: LysE family transporter [Spirochaetota bacterium]|nr:LysE family transporter [Spirochaetota bacterium]HPJ39978.1 LysE family transporter [Spirochaetota bacterium]HPQ53119.1 LysE family transporter [Spirochaetota bacterium]
MDYIFLLKIGVTVLFGMVLGAISSIPVGAVQLVVIKKSLNHQIKPAIATAAGSMTSDFIYGALTLFGFGSFLHLRPFQIGTYSLGIVVLSYIVYRTMKERNALVHSDEKITYKKRYSFLKGFTIAITNPGMIVWWLVGYKLYLDLNLFEVTGAGIRAIFVISGCLGLGGYLMFVGFLVYRAKNAFPEHFVHNAYLVLTVLLCILILYFGYKIVCIMYNFQTPF